LANGTECVNTVEIYQFNYTTQKYSSVPLTTNNPVEIAKIYYSVGPRYSRGVFSNNITIPDNSTLLCPSIVKSIKG